MINDLVFSDKQEIKGLLGGVVYALAGIKPYCDDVMMVTVGGPDYLDHYGEYFKANQLSAAGVYSLLPNTQYTELVYEKDGRWTESSIYGKEFDLLHALKGQTTMPMLLPFCDTQTKGIYAEAGALNHIWDELPLLREQFPHVKFMWEVFTEDLNYPALHSRLHELTKLVDAFSINLPESLSLFGTQSESESVQALLKLETPCFFRVGEKGAYMIQDGKAWFAPAYDLEQSVDPTGCGNCSTAASFYGFAEGFHPLMTVIKANLAAALNARQHGPYPLFTKTLREELERRAQFEFDRLRKDEYA